MKKLKTDKIILHSEVVKVIYARMQGCLDNIKENFEGEKLTLASLQKKLDRGSVDPEVLHTIAQDCAALYHLKGVLDSMKIDMGYMEGIRKQTFETRAWLWSEMVT